MLFDLNRKSLFIISSAVYITSNPLSYTATRSAFNDDERARQTLKTIQSIKTSMPEAQILLIEMGLKKDLPYDIEKMADKYLYLGNKRMIREAADGPFKGFGEALGLYLANRAIQSFEADYFYKLSGRYYLNEHFNENEWTADGYTGRDYYGGLFTVLYGFPKRLYSNWRDSLKTSFPVLKQGESLEIIQPTTMEKPLYYKDQIGVSGWESHSGSFISL